MSLPATTGTGCCTGPRSLVHHLESQSTSKRYRDFLLSHATEAGRIFEKWRDQLQHFGKPESSNPRAIEAGIQRARGNPGQLLVMAQANSSLTIPSPAHRGF